MNYEKKKKNGSKTEKGRVAFVNQYHEAVMLLKFSSIDH
jgi:hypothetical protein